MIDITLWLNDFLQKANATFQDRVWFVGLQGSYGRGEATGTSDIDIVLILDGLTASDIRSYQAMLDTLPHRELICGFLSGKEELLSWEPSDLFQFCHDTTPLKGSLDTVLRLVKESDVSRAIKIGACNIYHGCIHNMLHEKSEEALKSLYKSASFVIQAILFKQSGKYLKQQQDLLAAAAPDEQAVLRTLFTLKRGGAVDFAPMSDTLFAFAKKWVLQSD
ncbi:MAG: nucleotidyltransferase domain-containing protein [Clostridia bacterium]|nr:nucleotidyltransferase domain-containing protein [Clostridia bacterium]